MKRYKSHGDYLQSKVEEQQEQIKQLQEDNKNLRNCGNCEFSCNKTQPSCISQDSENICDGWEYDNKTHKDRLIDG